MPELKAWTELPAGGAVLPDEAPRVLTGGWRTGLRPEADLSRCVQCLLCWIWCPDSAVRLEGTTFVGFDLDVCKGCELCAAACPVDAIAMVTEETSSVA